MNWVAAGAAFTVTGVLPPTIAVFVRSVTMMVWGPVASSVTSK